MLRLCAIGLACALAACATDVIDHTAPRPRDAAEDSVDAGAPDAGPVEVDAGSPDAGVPDAGCASDEACPNGACVSGTCVGPDEIHPRLWVRRTDIARLRGWATSANPVFSAGLGTLAQQGIALMDEPPAGSAGNRLPDGDTGGIDYTPYPSESYAAVFALLSLVAPDADAREAYAARAKTLLMHVIDQAAQGAAAGVPFRDPGFSVGQRAKNSGPAFALAADWLHDRLSSQEKGRIRTVFLRWSRELATRSPQPFAAGETRLNDPGLTDPGDPRHAKLRAALGGDYAVRMRNLGLFALALDDADDTGSEPGALRAFLPKVLGQWLYLRDQAVRTDGAGGLASEGLGCFRDCIGAPLELLWALHTARLDDADTRGPQVSVAGHPFWSKVLAAYLEALPFTPAQVQGAPAFEPAWFGQAGEYALDEPIVATAPLGLFAREAADEAGDATARWIERNVPPGGAGKLAQRLREDARPSTAILGFLLFPPNAAAPADPRPAQELVFTAPALGRVVARTAWSADERLVTFRAGWVVGTGQAGDAGMLDFHRKGEWLTKERSGAGYLAASSDYKNTLAIETSAAATSGLGPVPTFHAARGSQFIYGAGLDPAPLVTSHGPGWVYASSDLAGRYVYDNGYTRVDDVAKAVRSVIWLQPDLVVMADHVVTRSAGRPKRFWLTLPGDGAFTGNRLRATTPGGQQLFVTTMLPAAVDLSIVSTDPTVDTEDMYWSFANGDPMNFPYSFPRSASVNGARRLKAEASGNPADVLFLNVLEGADASGSPSRPSLVTSTAGAAATGIVVSTRIAVFVERSGVDGVTLSVPGPVAHGVIAGLAPSTHYVTHVNGNTLPLSVDIQPGGTDALTDAAGVLSF